MGTIPTAFFDMLVEDFGSEWFDFKINLEGVRGELGLGPVSLPAESMDEINEILKITGLTKRLENIRRLE